MSGNNRNAMKAQYTAALNNELNKTIDNVEKSN